MRQANSKAVAGSDSFAQLSAASTLSASAASSAELDGGHDAAVPFRRPGQGQDPFGVRGGGTSSARPAASSRSRA